MYLPTHEPAEIRDDAQACALLDSLGIRRELDVKESERGLPFVRLAAFHDHPTHWILALRASGQLNRDNGYVVFALPKSRVSREMFDREFAEQERQLFPDRN